MQKLILGRALDPSPSVILANQPTRGLDVGAVAYVHGKLIEARDRGRAAVLLISEDLEEVLALADRVVVMSRGRLSTPSARGERSARAWRVDGRRAGGRGERDGWRDALPPLWGGSTRTQRSGAFEAGWGYASTP